MRRVFLFLFRSLWEYGAAWVCGRLLGEEEGEGGRGVLFISGVLALPGCPSCACRSSVLFANVCAGFICCCYEDCWGWRFLGFLGALWSLVHMGGAGVTSFTLISTGLGLRRCAYRWTRPLGGGRWGHYLRDPRGVHWYALKCASCFQVFGSDSVMVMLFMQALAGQPSLHGYYACMVCWIEEAPRGNCRQILCDTSCSPIGVFC